MRALSKPTLIVLEDFLRFKYCPFCGYDFVITEPGDFHGRVYCLGPDCEEEIDFTLIDEIKYRYPEKFKEWVSKL